MDYIGVIKMLDGLGRLVIPKEFRERYGLTQEVEVIATKDGILLRNPGFVLVREEKKEI